VETVRKLVETSIPTEFGKFSLGLYRSGSNEDHVAFVLGDVSERENVLTRVHSECFTGETLGSLRCDCSAQLHLALRRIAQEGAGVLIYLRQEGRGIGLLDKLRAYNLQDLGHDTVEANLLLGHDSDERSYDLATQILCDLNVRSIRLLTNNPTKIQGLRELGVTVTAREPLVAPFHAESVRYLKTKVERMGHTIDLALGKAMNGTSNNHHATFRQDPVTEIAARATGFFERAQRPFVTLCYAQSLDACLSSSPGKPLALSGPETLTLAHSLRASHDAVMVGIGTVLSDNPRLTVRHVAGRNPQPVVLDSKLRIPLDFHLLREPGRSAWVAAVPGYAPELRQAVEAAGAAVLTCARTSDGRVCLTDLLSRLASQGIRSVMVEGGVQVIRSLMASRLVDFLVITIAPRFIGGEHGVRVQTDLLEGPGVRNFHHSKIGDDLVLWGEPAWRA
jgi:3,4-dihydroxy 2-butanone 4-phosphate synthase/GTP cyclohydrolase II